MRWSLLLLALPAAALASGGGEHAAGPDWVGIGRHTLNLVILIGLIGAAVRRPLSDFLRFRSTEVAEQLEAAAKAKAEADAREAELEQRLAGFEAEVAELVELIRAEAASEKEAIIEEGKASAERIRNAAQTAADEELRRARVALRAEAVELAVQVATDVLGEEVGKTDHTRLTKDYVAQMKELAS